MLFPMSIYTEITGRANKSSLQSYKINSIHKNHNNTKDASSKQFDLNLNASNLSQSLKRAAISLRKYLQITLKINSARPHPVKSPQCFYRHFQAVLPVERRLPSLHHLKYPPKGLHGLQFCVPIQPRSHFQWQSLHPPGPNPDFSE